MKLTSPLYSLKAWKGLSASAISVVYHVEGSGVFRRRSSYTILEAWYTPTNPRTSLQQSGRSMFSLAIESWNFRSDEEKLKWEFYQSHRKKRPVMSGYNLYISKYLLTGGNPRLPSDMEEVLEMPAGIICMWSGLLTAVPTGWALCNGENGTPDLRGMFVKGAGVGENPGGSGGANTHGHDQHPTLAHAGAAVANHANHVVTQPGNHANHVFTQPTSHPATATSQASADDQARSQAGISATPLSHTHNTPVLAHSGGAVDAHSAHAGAAVDAHSAHGVTQPNNHATQSHSEASNEPVYYKIAFIMKL